METNQSKKDARIKSILHFAAALVAIAFGFFVWYNIPVKLLSRNADTITKINLRDGNTGRKATISDSEAVRFIVEALRDVSFNRDGLALGVGTSYRLSFVSDNGIPNSELVIQTGRDVKKGIFFYTLSDDTQDLVALSAYLEKILCWSQSEDKGFPEPPRSEDFQIPDLPTGELLQKDYSLNTDQIDYYIRSEDRWISKSVSDRDDIDTIIGEIDFLSLNAIAPAKQFSCEPSLYVDFNNGTVLACAESPSYIWFGHQIVTGQDEGISFRGEHIGPYGVVDAEFSNFLLQWIANEEIE